jgi:hypothetical protein
MHEHCLPPALISFTFSSTALQESGSIFLFVQIAILPYLTLVHLCHRLDDAVLSPLDHFFFCHASSEGLRVCVALWIGKLLWSQGGYGLFFVSRVFVNSSAGRFNWILKLSLPGMQD